MENLNEEIQYLEETLEFLRREIDKGIEELSNQRRNLVGSRKEMWENTVHFSNDIMRMTEVNQHLIEADNRARGYVNSFGIVEKYKKVIPSPYFGRFDFIEEGLDGKEKIYIGLHSVADTEGFNVYVYDWRSPIASIFYQYEIGKAYYTSPVGEIFGEVSLKRQYKIENSKLKYFFDSSIRISDEILQEILGRNASPKMKNIVETIQKEQDRIIRDTDNELLIVQGVAGSGKTSIALHRIAFLLYHGRHSNIGSNNIIIISPNNIFSNYISSVLPELGEENVNQLTFDEILKNFFKNRFNLEGRSDQLEALIMNNGMDGEFRRESIRFKGSSEFVTLIDRFLSHYVRRIIPIEDVYFNGQVLENRNQIRGRILNNKIDMPLSKHLKKIQGQILEKVHPLRRNRVERIEKIVQRSGNGHDLEIKSFSRLLSIKEAKVFMDRIRRFTEVDYFDIYKLLLRDMDLIYKLSKDIKLPDNIKEIILKTRESTDNGKILYEDFWVLLYIKLKLEGSDDFSGIKQVVIDEAQDYYPIHYEIFNMLFHDAKYTVLGDVNQTIEKNSDKTLYDSLEEILDKRKSVKVFLSKSYRSSYEISKFTRKILNSDEEYIPFDRHDNEPLVTLEESLDEMDRKISKKVKELLEEGFESVAVICKTQNDADEAYERLGKLIDIKLVKTSMGDEYKGVVIIASYMAKGLEFDAVIIYDASYEKYVDEYDRNLLYIGCTRALHRLLVYCFGKKSPLIG